MKVKVSYVERVEYFEEIEIDDEVLKEQIVDYLSFDSKNAVGGSLEYVEIEIVKENDK